MEIVTIEKLQLIMLTSYVPDYILSAMYRAEGGIDMNITIPMDDELKTAWLQLDSAIRSKLIERLQAESKRS